MIIIIMIYPAGIYQMIIKNLEHSIDVQHLNLKIIWEK